MSCRFPPHQIVSVEKIGCDQGALFGMSDSMPYHVFLRCLPWPGGEPVYDTSMLLAFCIFPGRRRRPSPPYSFPRLSLICLCPIGPIWDYSIISLPSFAFSHWLRRLGFHHYQEALNKNFLPWPVLISSSLTSLSGSVWKMCLPGLVGYFSFSQQNHSKADHRPLETHGRITVPYHSTCVDPAARG